MEKELRLIDEIRNKDLNYLSDPTNLEKLLPQLGLNGDIIEEYPKHLHKFCDKGLKSWQYPNQFSKYLVHLSKYKIESYIELGAAVGGTFIITVEYLNRFHPIKRALAVDKVDCPLLTKYSKNYNTNSDFWKIDMDSFKFDGFVNHCNGIDLILIDANHSFKKVSHDFDNAEKMGRMIALHDISNDACPDIVKFWQTVKDDPNKYGLHEFTDQYQAFRHKHKSFFGIGLLESKVFPVEKEE